MLQLIKQELSKRWSSKNKPQRKIVGWDVI